MFFLDTQWLGTLTRFAIQSAFVGLGFSGLSTFYSELLKSVDAAGRVFEQIDTNAAVSTSLEELPRGVEEDLTPSLSPTAPAVNVENISFAYRSRPDKVVLKDFSLHIPSGQFTCIVGRSGVGKSTLLSLLCGLLSPTTGEIRIAGTVINPHNANRIRCHVWIPSFSDS